jgi:hypothetical protein
VTRDGLEQRPRAPQSKNRYFAIAHSAATPSRQPIFLPSL